MTEPMAAPPGARELADRLLASYEHHPAFRFEESPWSVDPGVVTAFNDAYSLLSAYASRLARAEVVAGAASARAELDRIFTVLRDQTSDVLETRFLDELYAECVRLLTEEVALYRLPPRGGSVSLGGGAVRSDVLALERQRHYLSSLPVEYVHRLLDLGATDLNRFRQAAKRGELSREDLSVNMGPTARGIVHILNRAFAEQGVLDAVSVYAGQRMSVTGVALELSVPQATWWQGAHESLSRAPKTLYAHIDESIVYPKAIVYLTDVDAETGPTSCYPGAFEALDLSPLQALVGRVLANVGNSADSPLRAYYAKPYHQSMSSQRFRRHFMRLPVQMRFNSHFGWDVMPESLAEDWLVRRERLVLGKAGTYIVFDGARLVHRGGMLRTGERVALQVIFSSLGLARRVARKIRGWLP